MSIVNQENVSVITTQSGNNGIMYKNFLFGLKRKNKNGSEFWMCTHKVCNASIVTHQNLIIRTSSIKAVGRHEFEHDQKRLCSLCYRYILVLDTSQKDDADFEPIL